MKRKALVILLSVFICGAAHAQKEKYESLFIYNFTKYVKWPESYNNGEFVIGVYGDSPILTPLKKMADTKKKTGNGHTIIIKQIDNIGDIGNCNILFVSQKSADEIPEIDSQTKGKPMLLVSDTPGMAQQGSVINFVEENGKIKFELNESKAANRGLFISGSLSALAVKV